MYTEPNANTHHSARYALATLSHTPQTPLARLPNSPDNARLNMKGPGTGVPAATLAHLAEHSDSTPVPTTRAATRLATLAQYKRPASTRGSWGRGWRGWSPALADCQQASAIRAPPAQNLAKTEVSLNNVSELRLGLSYVADTWLG